MVFMLRGMSEPAGDDEAPGPAPPDRTWRYKDTAYLLLGSILLILGVLGVTATLTSVRPDLLVWGFVLCSTTGVAPGTILIVLGWRLRKEERYLVEFSSWIKTYRRIPMSDLAKNLGKTRFETEKILAQAVDRQLVSGIVDRSTDEFVVRESIGQQIFVEMCPHCAARINRWFLPEDRFVCTYCNQPILAATATPRTTRRA